MKSAAGWMVAVWTSPVAVKLVASVGKFLMKSENEKAGWKFLAGHGMWAVGSVAGVC